MSFAVHAAIVFDLVRNAALLALGVLGYCQIRHWIRERLPRWSEPIIGGCIFGGLGVLSILAPIEAGSGVLLDLRNAMVAIATLFGGPWAGATSFAVIVLFRLARGGEGVLPGILSLAIAFAVVVIDLAYLQWRGRVVDRRNLVWVGLAVAAGGLAVIGWFPRPAIATFVLLHVAPIWFVLMSLTVVFLGHIILHFERSRALTRALHEKEAELQAIMDNAPFAIFLKDRDKRYRLFNRAYEEWFLERADDLYGRTNFDIFPRALAERMDATDREVLEHGRVTTMERRTEKAKPGLEYTLTTKFPIRDTGGAVVGVAGFIADITDRTRTEVALSESRELLIESQQLGEMGYIFVDRVKRRVYWSDSMFELRRVPRREYFSFEEAMDFLIAEDRPKYAAARDAAIVKRRNFEIDCRILRGDGSTSWERSVGHPRFDDAGALMSMLVVVQDITDRKRAEEALNESRELLEESQELGGVGYALSDIATNRVYWSDSLFKLRGRPKKPFFKYEETVEFMHPEDRAKYAEARDAAIAERRDFTIDIRVIRDDGSVGWEHCVGHPRFAEDGSLRGVLLVVLDVTESRQAQEALRHSEERYRLLADNATDIITLRELGTERRLYVSPACRAFGYEPEEVAAFTPGEGVHPDDLAHFMAIRASLGPTHEFATATYRLRRKDGVYRWVENRMRLIAGGSSEPSLLVSTIRDISERRAAEDALRESQGRLQSILDNAPVAISLKDREHRYLVINKQYEAWFGVTPEQQLGRTLRDVGTEKDFAALMESTEDRVLATGTTDVAEIREPNIPTAPQWVLNTKFPVRTPNGNIVGVGTVNIDVSERRAAEGALRQSEERFRALIEHSDDIIAVITPDGYVTYRSPTVSEGLGFDGEERAGMRVFDLLHPEDADAFIETFRRLGAAKGSRAIGRSRLQHKDGTWRHIAWSARNASGVSGVDGIIVNFRDVTESRNLEEQLQQSQKMEAVGQLAGGIAHDFNNILGAILGFAGFLVQDLPEGQPERGFAERIVMAGERARDLVQQILAFSRRSSVERKPTDLARVARETQELLRASLPSSTRLALAETADRLIADVNAAQISQILLNLCLNANDALASEPGTVTIEVSRVSPGDLDYGVFRGTEAERETEGRIMTGALDPGRAYAKLSVADTGIGMDPGVLKRIFDPFFTTKERGQGTGLGLSVVHGIVMAYAGACIVTSRPLAGSVFTVYLPLSDGAAVAAPPVAEAGLRGNERVLVIDDEVIITDMLTIGLDRLGYEVVALNDAEEAIEVFAEDPGAWQVIVSDQVMPGHKGLTLFQRMKAIRPSVRFILCTGFSDGATEEMALDAGVDAFFLKPVSPERLAAGIRRVLDGPAEGTQLRHPQSTV